MTRQTEHYDDARESAEIAQGQISDAILAVEAMQRDLNHGLAHVATALAHLEPDCNPSVGAPEVGPAIAQLNAWLERMGVGHEPSVENGQNRGLVIHNLAAAEAAEALEDDRDALAATLERLYDNIDAALNALSQDNGWRDARRILRNARAGDNPLPEPECNCGRGPLVRPLQHGQFCRVYIHATTVRAIR